MEREIGREAAPAASIEITPAMIYAGAAVLGEHPMTENLSLGFCEDVARAVLERALKARHS
jgi:hypothetical protein